MVSFLRCSVDKEGGRTYSVRQSKCIDPYVGGLCVAFFNSSEFMGFPMIYS